MIYNILVKIIETLALKSNYSNPVQQNLMATYCCFENAIILIHHQGSETINISILNLQEKNADDILVKLLNL